MDKILKELSGLEYILECLKQYQRPILSIIFGVVMCYVFYQCISGNISCDENPLIETILYLMSSYMGIYGIGRSFEKMSSPAKNVVETVIKKVTDHTTQPIDRKKEEI